MLVIKIYFVSVLTSVCNLPIIVVLKVMEYNFKYIICYAISSFKYATNKSVNSISNIFPDSVLNLSVDKEFK